jgi:hypothetical protein
MEYWNYGKMEGSIVPTIEELKIESDYILRGLGMSRADADEYLLSLIDELISKCIHLAEPCSQFVVYDSISFDHDKHTIAIEELIFETGRIVTNSLKNSISIALFSATCGDKIETWSKQLMKEGHGLEGLIVDLIGSEMAEAIVEYLHHSIETEVLKSGNKVSNRYSPGYCNWPVTDQQKLFALLKGNDCGITLTESSLMLPIKSVSGMIGIGPSLKKAAYKCKVCPDMKCIMRAEG